MPQAGPLWHCHHESSENRRAKVPGAPSIITLCGSSGILPASTSAQYCWSNRSFKSRCLVAAIRYLITSTLTTKPTKRTDTTVGSDEAEILVSVKSAIPTKNAEWRIIAGMIRRKKPVRLKSSSASSILVMPNYFLAAYLSNRSASNHPFDPSSKRRWVF